MVSTVRDTEEFLLFLKGGGRLVVADRLLVMVWESDMELLVASVADTFKVKEAVRVSDATGSDRDLEGDGVGERP